MAREFTSLQGKVNGHHTGRQKIGMYLPYWNQSQKLKYSLRNCIITGNKARLDSLTKIWIPQYHPENCARLWWDNDAIRKYLAEEDRNLDPDRTILLSVASLNPPLGQDPPTIHQIFVPAAMVAFLELQVFCRPPQEDHLLNPYDRADYFNWPRTLDEDPTASEDPRWIEEED